MPTLKEERDEALKSAGVIFDAAKAASRPLSDDENARVKSLLDSVEDLDVRIKRSDESDAMLKRLGGLAPTQTVPGADDAAPKSLGEHFVKSVGAKSIRDFKMNDEKALAAPEFGGLVKANTDPHLVGSTAFAPLLTDVQQGLVRGYRRPVVSDLLGTTTVTGNAITYPIEGVFEGSPATVAEGAQKPQVHVANPTWQTDKLTKLAEWFDVSDEMLEDVPFFVNEINNRATYQLSLTEETQLLYGNGSGTNLTGITNRSGVQTVTQAVSNDSPQDTIFRAITAVQSVTGLPADGIVINPADYQTLRLSKDANNQYYGGGFFQGQYGTGGFAEQPPIWGVRTVVSAAVAPKTVLVGAFQPATAVFRKGGLRVEMTNSDLGKFTTNVVTVRIEERIGLQVKFPAAIVKVTLQ